MGTSSSKDTKKATPIKPNASIPPGGDPTPPLPGWTGPPPPIQKIPLSEMVSADPAIAKKAADVFTTQLRSHGYAILQLEDVKTSSGGAPSANGKAEANTGNDAALQLKPRLLAYRDKAAEFLQLPYELKQRYAPRQDDPLLRELGSVPNEGYVFTPKLTKEYIKIKPTFGRSKTPEQYFVDDEMRARFVACNVGLEQVARRCWSAVANYQSPDMTKPYMSTEVRDQAQLWADQRSSVSVIRYWKLSEKDKYLPTPEQLAVVKRENDEREAKLIAKANGGLSDPKSADGKSADAKSAPTAAPAASAVQDKKAPEPAAVASSTGSGGSGADAKQTDSKASAGTDTKADTNSAGDNGVLTLPAELPSAPKDSQFDESVHVPCGIHTDTGMLTFIICAPIAGLQIQNRFPESDEEKKKKKAAADSNSKQPTPEAEAVDEGYGVEKPGTVKDWLDVEKTCSVGTDLFVIAGRKCALFAHDKSREKYFTPTIHRVLLPSDTERYSILYFMDCQK